MGRESECRCTWNGISEDAKALLASTELILRGGVRNRIAFGDISELRSSGSELSFLLKDSTMTILFPTAIADAWAKRMASPPVSLKTKLGIKEGSVVFVYGNLTSAELEAAVTKSRADFWDSSDLAIAEVTTSQQLDDLLQVASTNLKGGVSLWIVYRKGPGHAVNETVVREAARKVGWRDSKVASISADWTGARFSSAR